MIDISFLDKGEGQPVLFLHGFCESKEIWSYYLENLSKHYRIVSADLPGFGKSPLTIENPTIDYYAEKIEELVEHLHLKNLIVIGHSFGGYITLSLIEKLGNRIKGFGLFHSSAFADSEEKKLNRNKTIDFVKKNGSALFAPTLISTLFTSENLKKFSNKVIQLTEVAANIPQNGIIGACYAMRERKDKTHVLKEFKGNVLFIIGKEDKAIPLEDSIKQCSIPASSLAYFIGDTAHMGMIEKEAECYEVVKNFISTCLNLNE